MRPSEMDRMERPPGLEPLEQARPLTPREGALVRRLVELVDIAALSAQAEAAVVVSECTCGCPSVGLATTAPALTEDHLRRLPGADQRDWAEIDAWGTSADGRQVQVNLHLVDGRLHELEVWAGFRDDADSVVALPDAETLELEPRAQA